MLSMLPVLDTEHSATSKSITITCTDKLLPSVW